jgi:D-glycero-alpha-D-manno-heptose 1-phosphate guanylyltransferase
VTTAIILAGGMGTRLREAVPDIPKPMAPVNGKPFIQYQLDYWIKQGITQFVISVGYKKEVIMDYLGKSYRNTPLTYSVEEEPLGTGGGLLLASQQINSETVLVMNGDTFFEVDLKTLQKYHVTKASDWTFSLFRSNENGRYKGLEMNSNGEITLLKSGTDQIGKLANGGVYLVNPKILEKIPNRIGQKLSLEDELLPSLLATGYKFTGIEFSGAFIDIGIPKDYLRAVNVIPYYEN